MASRRGGNFKVVAAGGVIAAALYIGSQMRGPGAGGENVGLDADPGATVDDTPPPGVAPDLELPEQTEPGMETAGQETAGQETDLVEELEVAERIEDGGAPPLIAVLVKEGEYLVAAPGKQTEVMPLDRVAAAARRTTGAEQGIRVRIEYHESARVTDEERLLAALSDAGIPGEAIQKKDAFAP